MYKRTLLLVLAIYGLWSLSACKKFLDIAPSSTSVNPIKIQDFQEILNSDSLSKCHFYLLDVMSDDLTLTDAQVAASTNYYQRSFLWQSLIWNPSDVDVMYNSTYSRILQMNIILDRVNDAPADNYNTPENKSNVISQALINRAWYYLQLVNAYGAAYDATTSATDPGVPLTVTATNYTLLPRASVADVYAQVIADLKTAVKNPYLKSKGTDIIHPGKASGYALLARAYLYEGDYVSASNYADSVLATQSTLQSYSISGYVAPSQLPDLTTNPEILLGRVTLDIGFYTLYTATIMPSSTLTSTLTTSDLRYSKKFASASRFAPATYAVSGGNSMFFDNSVGVPEVMLIKAECLARSGNFAAAGALITTLRKARLTASTFAAENRTYTAANILGYVLDERRRELFYHGGLRLFDLKRLNKDATLKKDITRLNNSGKVIATLPAGSGLYLVPFSPTVLAANPNIVQNPR
ncbi:SusD-like starch-binding protein associating with outer membrane [Mucilaginibacter gracilis]|uniref:SusD-like starch-binding protein associating with outer membrane n=1 Tax=Mucilaginibacter gracilis TaxID=423350 RepID=A0A495IYL8_9SPHI|nr:RagB/SusD family nutrient uptake outer membrane protein [Mucilaginibacter gracilis]RKR81800.1 SusD-like starch-binding protein associating with outer membrane [Mucilaginibacter gracilis]